MILKQKESMFLKIICVLLVYCLPVTAHAAVVLSDDFDSGALDPDWSVSFQDAVVDGWTYAESGTELTVTDITPTVINPGGGGTWAVVTISRDIVPVNDFSVDFRFSWDSKDPSTGSRSTWATQNLYMTLYDDTGAAIVLAGIHDAWGAWTGEKYAQINTDKFNSGYNS